MTETRVGRRAGFTLVETLVAVVIASVLMVAIYQVLVTNQRVSAVQREQVLVQGTLRAGLDILAQELREASPRDGDFTLIDAQRVGLRAFRAYGVACAVTPQGTAPKGITVVPFGRPFQSGEAIYVFADGDLMLSADDAWLRAAIPNVPSSTSCPGGGPAAQGIQATGPVTSQLDRIRPGAVIRSYREVEYALEDFGGQAFLIRIQGNDVSRIVGPLNPDDGLALEYLDGSGTTTATPEDVRQVRITLRASSEVRRPGVDSSLDEVLSTTVSLRN